MKTETPTATRFDVPPTTQTVVSPVAPANSRMRSAEFHSPRRRWPGVLAACVLGTAIGALAVSSMYDERSMGERLDATVAATHSTVLAGVGNVAREGSQVGDRAAAVLNDAGITAAVKTSLAADPRLSAVKIDVDTKGGIVSLEGPAPDEKSRERAELLAAAPEGVTRVDNRLVVTPELR